MSRGYLPKFHQILRLPRKVTLQHHQMLCLPRKVTVRCVTQIIWNVMYSARSNRCDHPTSPNTAPPTKNGSLDWSSSQMERHLQRAEQSPHIAPATENDVPKYEGNARKTDEESLLNNGGRFDHDPSMIRTQTRHLAPARSPRLLFALRRRILY